MQLTLDKKEMLRYWGCGGTDDEQLLSMAEQIGEKAAQVISPKCVYREFECSVGDDGNIDIGDVHIISRNLSKCLDGCDRAIMFAATLGTELDKQIKKHAHINMAASTAYSAAGSAFIETYCDIQQEEIRRKYDAQNMIITPRFSPGYGDFSLEHQRDFFRQLDITRKIGITLTDSLLMIPSKSVTAVIGIKNK